MSAAAQLALFGERDDKGRKARILSALKGMLLRSETYNVHDVLAQYAPSKAARDVREVMLLLHEAKEAVLQSDAIDFGPKCTEGFRPGTYERKSWLQMSKRSCRQRLVGIRKQKRALDRARAAAAAAPDIQTRDLLSNKADRHATSLEMARRRSKLLEGAR